MIRISREYDSNSISFRSLNLIFSLLSFSEIINPIPISDKKQHHMLQTKMVISCLRGTSSFLSSHMMIEIAIHISKKPYRRIKQQLNAVGITSLYAS